MVMADAPIATFVLVPCWDAVQSADTSHGGDVRGVAVKNLPSSNDEFWMRL